MSAQSVDVLRIMEHSIATCGDAACLDCIDIRKARAAVAELIEAADVLADAITFRIDDPRAAVLDRVVKALTRCGGAA